MSDAGEMVGQIDPDSPEKQHGPASRADKRSSWRLVIRSTFVRHLVVVGFCVGLWALATPMFGSPDEPAHMVRAYALVHRDAGEVTPGSQVRTYLMPPVLVPHPPCFPFNGSEASQRDPCDTSDFDVPCYISGAPITADCLNIDDSGPSVRIPSRTGSYPPLGHILAGWPSLITSGLRSLYSMRLASGLAAVALIALAFDTATRSRWAGALRIGLGLSLTPIALFLSGTVNPNGPAIAAAAAAWVGGFVLISEDADPRARFALARWGAPFCVYLLLRRDSLLWGALQVVVLLSIISWQRLRALLRMPRFWAWSGAILVCVVLQLALWGGESSAVLTSGGSEGGHAMRAFEATFDYLRQMIDILGWTEFNAPNAVWMVWTAVVLTISLVAIAGGTRRMRLVVAFAVVLTVGAMTGIGAFRYPYLWGRYVLPFSMGVPLMSAVAIAQRRDLKAFLEVLRRSLVWVLPVLQTLAFAQMLRRYSVGDDGPYTFLWRSKWSPPYGPISVFCALYAVASLLMYRVILRADDPEERRVGSRVRGTQALAVPRFRSVSGGSVVSGAGVDVQNATGDFPATGGGLSP